MWVYDASEILNDINGPHTYFQERLLMNVNLMAPVFGADHSIEPNQTVQIYYNQYGPLFKALRGTTWWLQSQTVEIIDENDNEMVINSFLKNVNGNIVIVLALGNWNITQTALNVTGSQVESCKSLNVKNNGKWVELNVDQDHRRVNITEIAYGCAVVSCVPTD